uniref:Uncharacterized protein n=1 Tax=Syphacia muris TaxID=451379 RepID=A0A0N5A7K7_9BILA
MSSIVVSNGKLLIETPEYQKRSSKYVEKLELCVNLKRRMDADDDEADAYKIHVYSSVRMVTAPLAAAAAAAAARTRATLHRQSSNPSFSFS